MRSEMENYLDKLQSMVQDKGHGKLENSLQAAKQNQLYELAIVLETIRQVRPDITIDEETYNQVSQLINQLEADTDKHISSILLEQQNTRAAIVAALTKTAPISISQAAASSVASTNTKTVVTKLPADYIKANRKEFLIYMAALLRKEYGVQNVNSLKPNAKNFDRKTITIEHDTFTYTKDAYNILNNLANMLGHKNLNFTKLLEEIEQTSPSGVEIAVQIPSSNSTQSPATDKVVVAKSTAVAQPKVWRQFNIFTDILADKNKEPALKKTFLEAIQKKMSPEKPEEYDLTRLQDTDLETVVDIEFGDIKFQGSIKAILTGLAKTVYKGTNLDKAICYLLGIERVRGRKKQDNGTTMSASNNGLEKVTEEGDNNSAARILDIIMDSKYGFPGDFASRLAEVMQTSPDWLNTYIQNGVTGTKVTLGSIKGRNLNDHKNLKLLLFLPQPYGERQETTLGHFLESIAYIRYGTYDIEKIIPELFPETVATTPQQPEKPITKPQPQPVAKKEEPKVVIEFKGIHLGNAAKFQELMMPVYKDQLIEAKRLCKDNNARPEQYNKIIEMLQAMSDSIEHAKASINERNYKAAGRTINRYKQMESATLSGMFARESNALFMIKEIHEMLTTKDYSRI